MSLRWVGVSIAAIVLAGSAIGAPSSRGVLGGDPPATEVIEELRGNSIACRDKFGQSKAYFGHDLVVASSQYGTRVVEEFTVSDDKFVRRVVDSDDRSLLGRVLTSTITYYDRAELRITTSGASVRGLRTTCKISKGDVFALSPLPGQDWSTYGQWIQLFSLRDQNEAINLAAGHLGALAFQDNTGWYVVVLGPFMPGTAKSVRDELTSQGSIPKDSFITAGKRFTKLVWGIEPSPPSLAPVVTAKTAPPEGGDGETTFSMNGGAVVKISYREEAGQKIAVISVEGALKPGDHKSFNQAAINAEFAIVALNSPGGSLQAGIEIGQAIRLKEFATVVPKGASCASACALAWLGGQPRYMERGSHIGFHAPRRIDDPTLQADSAASAIVGAYLNKLGLPSRAIAYFTEKRPTDMLWLTLEDADRLGIYVKEVPPEASSASR